MSREVAIALEHEIRTSPELIGAFMREFARIGANWSESEYNGAIDQAERLRALFRS